MSQPSNTVRTTQAASILLSTTTAGSTLALSALLVPRLLESPTPLMLRQWVRSHNQTRTALPALGSAAALAYLFLSWHHRRLLSAFQARTYLAAGLLCFGALPYTWVVIRPTSSKILRKADELGGLRAVEGEDVDEEGVGPLGEESAKWLVDHWGMLNLGRGIAWALAGVLGLAATV